MHLIQQTNTIIDQRDIIQKQARVMAALIFIYMVFLPLGLFASVSLRNAIVLIAVITGLWLRIRSGTIVNILA